jgi:Membrane-associating domain
MGYASKAVSVFFRIAELGSAVIVAGLVGRYLSYVHDANTSAGSRVIYTIVVAGISIIASLILIIPGRFSFFMFPLDAILFILWIVSFGLLVNVSYV